MPSGERSSVFSSRNVIYRGRRYRVSVIRIVCVRGAYIASAFHFVVRSGNDRDVRERGDVSRKCHLLDKDVRVGKDTALSMRRRSVFRDCNDFAGFIGEYPETAPVRSRLRERVRDPVRPCEIRRDVRLQSVPDGYVFPYRELLLDGRYDRNDCRGRVDRKLERVNRFVERRVENLARYDVFGRKMYERPSGKFEDVFGRKVVEF